MQEPPLQPSLERAKRSKLEPNLHARAACRSLYAGPRALSTVRARLSDSAAGRMSGAALLSARPPTMRHRTRQCVGGRPVPAGWRACRGRVALPRSGEGAPLLLWKPSTQGGHCCLAREGAVATCCFARCRRERAGVLRHRYHVSCRSSREKVKRSACRLHRPSGSPRASERQVLGSAQTAEGRLDRGRDPSGLRNPLGA
jgi:hypothetical protein